MARKSSLRAADRRRNALFVLPMAVFAVLLVALPLMYVLGTSLVESGQDFSFGAAFTLDNYRSLLRADYLQVFLNSIKLAFFTTLVSFIISSAFQPFEARAMQ